MILQRASRSILFSYLRPHTSNRASVMVPQVGRHFSSTSRRAASDDSDTSLGFNMLEPRSKVRMIREMMVNRRLDAYVVPSTDDHASEYLAHPDQRRAFLTHFTGSAGTAIVTSSEALMWTDGRYWVQAERELDLVPQSEEESNENGGDKAKGVWTLMKSGKEGIPPWTTWLARGLGDMDDSLSSDNGSCLRIGIDPKLLSWADHKKIVKRFEEYKEAHGVCPRELIPMEENLVDEVWATDVYQNSEASGSTASPDHIESGKPPRHISQIFILPDNFSGLSFPKKLSHIRDRLHQTGASGLLITDLDEICWMFNLRAEDIPFNPVFFGYAMITGKECRLFVHLKAVGEEVEEYLRKGGVEVRAYEEVWEALRLWGRELSAQRKAEASHPGEAASSVSPKRERWVYTESEAKDLRGSGTSTKGKILIGNRTSWAVANALGEENVEVKRSLVEDAKAVKNATEIEGFRQAHIRDGAALCRYFAWLEEILHAGTKINEYDAATKLEEYRKQNEHFKGLSFATISSTGPNGAVIHYEAPSEGSSIIDSNAMYLCDSGAQYLDATTDTTRTLHFGTPTPEEKRNFTRVLQGHIGIDMAVFPKNTTGFHLDIMARRPLWGEGLDYRHGTGHGVGAFLNVHEGPHGIGAHEVYNEVPLKEGMVISNEPGYYADGQYGIRIENIVIVRRADPPNNYQDTGFMEMEHVTMCPIQTSLVEASLLAPVERKWLDEYHEEVLVKVKPVLEGFGDARALAWLERECRPL